MKPTFDIQFSHTSTEQANLFLEIGLQGISFIVIDNNNNCCALVSYHFSAESNSDKTAVHFKQIVAAQPILQQVFKKISIIYCYPKSLLVPHQYFHEENTKELLELLFGDTSECVIRKEFVYQQNLHNIYAVPQQVDSVVNYLFSADSYTHLYSLLPNILRLKENILYCIFGSSNFIVMLVKDGNLQIIQTFQYKSINDVTYYLLQLCASFEVPVNEIKVLLNGMIDVSSNLYFELNKYFLHLQLQELPELFSYPKEIEKYPAHYFSHLFAIAACV